MAIVLPLQGLEIAEILRAAFRDGLDVVNLPAPLLGLAVLASLHARTTGVLAEPCVVWFGFCLCPYSFDGLLIEGFSTGVCIWLSCHD